MSHPFLRKSFCAVLLCLLGPVSAWGQTDYSPALVVGAAPGSGAPTGGSTLKIVGAPTRASGQGVLSLDGSGNVKSGGLVLGDMPVGLPTLAGANNWSGVNTFTQGLIAPSIRSAGSPFYIQNSGNSAAVASFGDGGVALNQSTTLTGDLTIASGPLRRIFADFSTDAYNDRVSFQTTVPNGWTTVSAMPNGSGTVGAFNAWNTSNPSGGGAYLSFRADAALGVLQAGKVGPVPEPGLMFAVNNQERVRFPSAGNVRWGQAVDNVYPERGLYTGLGLYLNPYSVLHVGELRAAVMVVNETQAYTEASLKVGRGSTLARDIPSDTHPYIYSKTRFTKYADFLIMRGLGDSGQPQFEVMQVNGAAIGDCTGAIVPLPAICDGIDNDDYGFQVARNVDGSGGNVWRKGSALVSMDRWIDIFSDSGGFISFGNAVLGDHPSVYWNFDGMVTPAPNLAGGPRGYAGVKTPLVQTTGTATYGGCMTWGCMQPTSGYGGWFTTLDGHAAIANPTDVPELNTTAMAYALSVELVMFTGVNGAGPGYAVNPVTRWNGTGDVANFVVYYFGDGGLDGQIGLYGNFGGVWSLLTGFTTLNNNQWYHLVFTFDSYNGGDIYKDGVRVVSVNSPAPGYALNGNTQPLAVHSWRSAAAGDPGYGSHIGELAIYDYQLGADAVLAHWNALQVQRPNLVNGPSMVGYVATGTNWYDQAPRWALGNLQGLYDYSTQVFGLAAGDVTKQWIGVDPDNGIRMMTGAQRRVHLAPTGELLMYGQGGERNVYISGSTIVLGGDTGLVNRPFVWIDPTKIKLCGQLVSMCSFELDGATGNITSTGSITIGAGGHIKGGATGYAAGTGFFLGYDGGDAKYKFSIGSQGVTTGAQYLRWTGDALEVSGASIRTGSLAMQDGGINDGTGNLTIGVSTVGARLILGSVPANVVEVNAYAFRPVSDNATTLGLTTNRYSGLHVNYPTTGINSTTNVLVTNTSSNTTWRYTDGLNATISYNYTDTTTGAKWLCSFIVVAGIITGPALPACSVQPF